MFAWRGILAMPVRVMPASLVIVTTRHLSVLDLDIMSGSSGFEP
jgi:hypothetical protein